MTSLDNATVILNPAASGGRGHRLQHELERDLTRRNIPFELLKSESPGHAKRLSREAVRSGAEILVVVGGDGTLHEVVNGILSESSNPPPIAVIPVGTGNDFFRMLGRPGKVPDLLDGILAGGVRRFDVGRAHYGEKAAYFVNLLGVGVDVEVLRKRENFPRLKGLPQYLAALVSALADFRPAGFRVSFEGRKGENGTGVIDDRTILVAVTVGPSVAGGFMLNPEASPYDGLVDLFFVKPLGMIKLASYIPKVIRGTHKGAPELIQEQVVSAEVRQSDGGAFFFEMDGERMPDPVTRLELEVCPGILPVIVPGKTS